MHFKLNKSSSSWPIVKKFDFYSTDVPQNINCGWMTLSIYQFQSWEIRIWFFFDILDILDGRSDIYYTLVTDFSHPLTPPHLCKQCKHLADPLICLAFKLLITQCLSCYNSCYFYYYCYCYFTKLSIWQFENLGRKFWNKNCKKFLVKIFKKNFIIQPGFVACVIIK